MRWDFHGLIIDGTTNDVAVRDHWQATFASCSAATATPDLAIRLDVVADVPPPPPGEPQFRQGDLLSYTLSGDIAVAHFPRFGQLRLDLAKGHTEGQIVRAALETNGVFEDLVAIGLSPHLRRRGLFLIHAFAAAYAERALLLVGGIGAGKTTTGMALLDAGWRLLSNDSPVIRTPGEVLRYPGLVAAYPDTFARFEATAEFSRSVPVAAGRKKLVIAAERIWPDVWTDRAPAWAICFPQIASRADHAIEPLAPPDALRRLLPHAVEQWDRALIPEHLQVLRQLVESAPAYLLRLGPDVYTLPARLANLLSGKRY